MRKEGGGGAEKIYRNVDVLRLGHQIKENKGVTNILREY